MTVNQFACHRERSEAIFRFPPLPLPESNTNDIG